MAEGMMAMIELANERGEELQALDLSFEELQELVVHVGVRLGWLLARRLDDLLVEVAGEVGASDG